MKTEAIYHNAFKLFLHKRICDFYADPAHGWLKVPLKDLEKLNIMNNISECSMYQGNFAYLEEDCDAYIYWYAMKSQGYNITIKNHYSNRLSRIRQYKHFSHNLKYRDDWHNVIGEFYQIAKQKVDLAIKFNIFKVYEGDKVRYASGRDERDFKSLFGIR